MTPGRAGRSDTLHAHHIVELIGPPGLRWVGVPEPDTTAQLVVEVMAAGVSFADLLYTRGRYRSGPPCRSPPAWTRRVSCARHRPAADWTPASGWRCWR